MGYAPLVSFQGVANGFVQGGQSGGDIGAEVDAQEAALAFGKNVEIPARLGDLDHSEGELVSGHRQISGVVAGNLDKDASVRSALERLAGSRRVLPPR
jgi:hypothetical protein